MTSSQSYGGYDEGHNHDRSHQSLSRRLTLIEVSQRWNFPTTVFDGDACLFLFNFSHLAFLLGSDAASHSQTSEEEGVIFVNSQDGSTKTKKGVVVEKFAVHKNELSGFCQAEKQEEERTCDREAQDQRQQEEDVAETCVVKIQIYTASCGLFLLLSLW